MVASEARSIAQIFELIAKYASKDCAGRRTDRCRRTGRVGERWRYGRPGFLVDALDARLDVALPRPAVDWPELQSPAAFAAGVAADDLMPSYLRNEIAKSVFLRPMSERPRIIRAPPNSLASSRSRCAP